MSFKKGPLYDRSFLFAKDIVLTYKELVLETHDYVLFRQLLRSGTSIGALIREAEFAQSKPDFISKLNIALKEANECIYWLNLLNASGYLNDKLYNYLNDSANQIIALLVTSLKTLKSTPNP